ncbi:MAG TPA: CGNR zinc finger domain-containing protein [Edaphobacter sp.]|jgi:predicted RNA-binding Zn ribbon-like protein|nr:CGNR zinc finger domain-containing protein [Edaphobacter sp.]
MRDVAIKAVLANPITHQIGGHLAFDFCNTAGEHLADKPDEMFPDWESFIRWAAQVGLVTPETYFELLRHPSPIGKIVQLREAIYRVGLAIARGDRIPQSDLLAIRAQANAAKPTVVNGRDGLRWQPDPSRASAQLRSILATEALSLFCSPRSARIGICEGGQCGWLFLDESRGKRRRWCDMNDCGNRAKARRYYQQQHQKK